MKTSICLAGALLFLSSALATASESSGHPYQTIIAKNVFRLTMPREILRPKPLLPVITWQGITSLPGLRMVYFKVVLAPKPGEPPREAALALSDGERAGQIEILQIDESAGTVRLRNHGEEQLLRLGK